MTAVETGTSSYTHVVCARCGKVLYCSHAEPWHPQREFGWCWHQGDEPEAVGTDWPGPTDLHNCKGEMRPLDGREGSNEQAP